MKIYRPLSDQWAVFLDGKIKSAGWVAGDASLDRSLTDSIGLAMTKHASTKRDGTIHIRIGDLSSYAILT